MLDDPIGFTLVTLGVSTLMGTYHHDSKIEFDSAVGRTVSAG